MHVAKKMGIIEKDADLTSSLLQKVMSLYRDGVPFEEAWRTFKQTDVDIRGLSLCLSFISKGLIKVIDLGRLDKPSPLASIALEEMSRKGEIMDPSRLKRLALEGAKVRAYGTPFLAVCINCWKYVENIYLSEVKELKCPECGSSKIASVQEEEEVVESISRRMQAGEKPAEGTRKIYERIKKSALLNDKFGINSVIAQFFRIQLKDIEGILSKHIIADDSFYQALLDAERRENLRRFIS